ncbi:tetratricopeptide repeat protein [Mucisphaera calidilacus]|uniref:Tetratricopeptide repeat protein n=1 Tax=Mucisphaera calidilacus TaxID=2527982 RepID=A0A518BTA0_9BACT|nr:tetratricopeptide repeat protein [Mucisphaera calidilacus]QDU70203.1 tetratricopeptide repeat protein [Mucisphaera calidilacus]
MARQFGVLFAVALAAVFAIGCESTRDVDQHKVEADARWWDLRGNMILEQAQYQFDNSELDQAEATLHEAMRISPENPRLLILAGRIALERGELERAAIALRSAAEADPQDAVAHYYLGIVEQRWQRTQAARDHYARAAELDPDNLEYLLAHAESEVALGNDAQAVALMEQRLGYFAHHAALHHALGRAMVLVDRRVEALDHLHEAAILDPDNLTYRTDLAFELVDSGQPEEAGRILAELLKDPRYAERHDLRRAYARACEEASRWAEARRLYRDLCQKQDPLAQDLLGLARMSWQLGDATGAERAAARVIERHPNNSAAMIWLGLAALERDDALQASRWFEMVTALTPEDAQGWALYGTSLQRLGRLPEAVEAYRKAHEIDPGNPQIRALLSQVRRPANPA